MLKTLLGIIIILAGIFLGLWLGLYICLWGGVLSIISAVKAGTFLTFLWGVVKIMFAGIVGWGSFLIVSGIGVTILNS